MQKTIALAISVSISWIGLTHGFSYPIKEVSKLECRTMARDSMPASCKIPLPIITDAQYSLFANNKLYTDIYTTLRGATYKDGRDIMSGAHPGIDIATARGTPVYSIGDGEVTFAGRQEAYGYNIKIKYRYGTGYIFATYAHLDETLVTSGMKVSEGKLIGKVWNTGRVFGQLGGYHLNLDISTDQDKNNRPDYFFLGCNDRKTFWEVEITNKGLCRKEMFSYTLDPIQLLESTKSSAFVTTQLASNTTSVIQSSLPVKSISETTSVKNLSKVSITSSEATTWSQISNETVSLFFKKRDIKTSVSIDEKNLKGKLIVTIQNRQTGKGFEGILPEGISVISSNNKIKLSIQSLQLISQGKSEIPFEISTQSKSTMIISMSDQSLGSHTFIVN